jgi:indolepyruvate ferredoxin oxidoreductase
VVAEAVARNLFKLMAVKDEYEVARLYTDGAFKKQLAAEFEHYDRLEFHLAPPILNRRGPDGRLRKSKFGPWMMKAFGVLAALKGLRGTAFDLFGYSEERRMEKRLLAEYESDIDRISGALSPERIEAAAALASVPSLIRGFGHVKAANAAKAAGERERLTSRFLHGLEASEVLQAAE